MDLCECPVIPQLNGSPCFWSLRHAGRPRKVMLLPPPLRRFFRLSAQGQGSFMDLADGRSSAKPPKGRMEVYRDVQKEEALLSKWSDWGKRWHFLFFPFPFSSSPSFPAIISPSHHPFFQARVKKQTVCVRGFGDVFETKDETWAHWACLLLIEYAWLALPGAVGDERMTLMLMLLLTLILTELVSSLPHLKCSMSSW